jgi:hypothetical protein
MSWGYECDWSADYGTIKTMLLAVAITSFLLWHISDFSYKVIFRSIYIRSTEKLKYIHIIDYNQSKLRSHIPFFNLYCIILHQVVSYKTGLILLSYAVEETPYWEPNPFSAGQEIPHILRNSRVHYHIHKCPAPVIVLSQIDPVHYPTSWRSIVILYSHLHLGLPSGLFPSGFPTKTLYTLHLSPICATCPTHFILLYFITQTIQGEEYGSLSSSLHRLD